MEGRTAGKELDTDYTVGSSRNGSRPEQLVVWILGENLSTRGHRKEFGSMQLQGNALVTPINIKKKSRTIGKEETGRQRAQYSD